METPVYDLIFHQLAIKNTVRYADALFQKKENQRHDWEILKALTVRLGGQENPADLEQTLDFLLQFSSYKEPTLSVSELKKRPHGIDFGALKPQLPERLFTADKKIEMAHPLFIKDLERLDKTLSVQPDNRYPFSLIGRRHLRSNNSWMHNIAWLTKGKNRCTVFMHPKDAASLNLNDGEKVRVSSSVGSVVLPVEITETMMPGVLSIPHGWGHHRAGIQLEVAQQQAGVSLNDLTDSDKLDVLTGNADFSGTRVMVEKWVFQREPLD